jgi:hypothetical protein
MAYSTINTNLEPPPFRIPIYDDLGVMNTVWVRWFQGIWDRSGSASGDSVYDAIKAAAITSATEPQLYGIQAATQAEITGLLLSVIEQLQGQNFDPSALLGDIVPPPQIDYSGVFDNNNVGTILSIAKTSVGLDDVLATNPVSSLAMQTGGHTVTGVMTATSFTGSGTGLTSVPATSLVGNIPVTNLNSGTSASTTTFWRGDGIWAVPSTTGNTDGGRPAENFGGNFPINGGTP